MGRRWLTILGALAVALAALAPFLLRFDDPFETSGLRPVILSMHGLDSELLADALRLRLGVQNNYDSLARRETELRELQRTFTAGLEELGARPAERLGAVFAPLRESEARRARILQEFPVDNAKLGNALLLLGATYERARQRLGEDPQLAAVLSELQELNRLALAHHACGDENSRAHLERSLARSEGVLAAQGGSAAAMFGHARTLLVQKDVVDRHIAELLATSGEDSLHATFEAFEQEARFSAARSSHRRALLAVACILVVVLVCVLGAWTALRQNASLEREIEERARVDREARKLEAELRQAQKLESIGQLAAGIAHEINTPIQFVSDSVHFVRDAHGELSSMLTLYRGQLGCLERAAPECARALAAAEQEADLDYTLEQAPRALERALDGLERVATIVRCMKEFAHPEQKEMESLDLNRAVECTLTIAASAYKDVAEVHTELGEVPPVTCHGGSVNQVLLSLLLNAAQAIGEVVQGTGARGRITVRTRQQGESVVVEIEDTGCGIPPGIRERIFDPFFTTKEVGKGTGQGLTSARSIIVDKHGGTLSFESEVGRGSVFRVALPVTGPARREPVRGVAA